MVGATIRTVFAQPDIQSAREQWRRVSDGFRSRFPKRARLLDEAEEDVLSYTAFPPEHWPEGLVQQPARAAKQGGEEKDQRGGLPQRSGSDPADGSGALGATRRVAGLQALLQRQIVSEVGERG